MKSTFNFTNEEMNIITSLTKTFVNSVDTSKSVKENMVSMLQERLPYISQELALNVARDLLKGITGFTANYEELREQPAGNDSLYERCMEQIEDRTPQEQAACILNFISVMKTLDITVLGDLLADANADVLAKFEAFKSMNSQVVEGISEEQLSDLKNQLRDTIENNAIYIAGDKQMAELLETLEVDSQLAEALVTKGLQDMDYKAYAALAAYVAYKNRRLPSLSGEIDVELLGMSVAAGMERSKVIAQAKGGLISWETAFNLLKCIGGALIIGLFIWINLHLMLLGIGAVSLVLSSLIGSATLGLIAGVLIGGYGMYKALDWLYDNVEEPILNGLGDAYDKVIEYFSGLNIISRIKEGLKKFWAYISENTARIFRPVVSKENPVIIGA